MLFYEPIFLFVFLPSVLAIYILAGFKPVVRVWILFVASVLFYAWGEPGFMPLVIASSLLDYAFGRAVARGSRGALAAGIVANLSLLVFYKYLGFLLANLLPLFAPEWVPRIPAIALPIGVSFIVFEKITYLVDIGRGRSQPAATVVQYLTYVMFFPKLLAGPIIKYHDIEPQFRHPRSAAATMIFDGFARFMQGVIKKILLADVLGTAADAVFAQPPGAIGFADAWSGVVLFTLQIYLDFSAYSDMAIGIAMMFGFRLRENFNMPYISCSVTEFWQRWHISLTSWIREYLYIPLGGNRGAPWRTYVNLWICFLASGLWHGAAWTYVLWGAYNGLFLVLERWFLLRWLDRLPRWAANAATLFVVMLGWAVFRAASVEQLGEVLGAMVHPGRSGAPIEWHNDTLAALVVGIVIALAPRAASLSPLEPERWRAWLFGAAGRRFGIDAMVTVLFTVAVSMAMADPFKPFLYFRF